jgi:hypothetical protein
MKLLFALIILFSASFCNALGFKAVSGSEYIQVTKSPFDRFVIKSKTILTKYDKIIFKKLAFNEFVIKPSPSKAIDRTWNLTKEDKDQYADSFKSELLDIYAGDYAQQLFGLGEGRFPNTLLAKPELITLLPLVAQNGEDISGAMHLERVESFGSLSIRITLVDSVTNEIVAIVEDGKDLNVRSTTRFANNKSNNAYAWQKNFNLWLTDLKSTLVELKTKE